MRLNKEHKILNQAYKIFLENFKKEFPDIQPNISENHLDDWFHWVKLENPPTKNSLEIFKEFIVANKFIK